MCHRGATLLFVQNKPHILKMHCEIYGQSADIYNHRLCIVEQLPFHLLRSKFKVQQLSFYLLFNFHLHFLLNGQFEKENINSQSLNETA